MAATRVIKTRARPGAVGHYSQGIVANGFLFTAGQVALDPTTGTVITGDIAAQAEQVLKNVGAILAAAGATWGDVVKAGVSNQHGRLCGLQRGVRPGAGCCPSRAFDSRREWAAAGRDDRD